VLGLTCGSLAWAASARFRRSEGRLARYKVPRLVLVTDELPVLPTGKVDKKLLRARYAAGTQTAATAGAPVRAHP
jgi:acyl-CoA synthetase (AMP-forming)/AMP-acid ligase II